MHSHKYLIAWLKSDLGCISDLEQLVTHCKDFLKKNKEQSSQDNHFMESVFNPLQTVVSTIENPLLNKAEKIDITNRLLKNIFVRSFFKEEHYNQRRKSLKTTTNYETEVVSRLKSTNPLGTLDVILTLRKDDRNPTQIEKAATLISATLSIFENLTTEKKMLHNNVTLSLNDHGPFFARTVITSDNGNIVYSDPQSKHITILVNGNAYHLPVIDNNNKVISSELLTVNLEAIINDFNIGNYSSSLGSITAAPRKLCNETRKKLEKRAENASFFKIIDSSLFVVCLDQGPILSGNREKQIKRLFTNFTNRWYGAMQIVIGPSGEAGIIGSYIRGDNLLTGIQLFGTINDIASNIPIINKTTIAKSQFKKLTFDIKEDDLYHLVEATKPYFHTQQSLFNLDIGISFFIKRGLHPNAALQLLIMLATRDIDSQKKLPIFKQALAVKDTDSTGSSLDWTFIPTHKINKFVTEVDKKELRNDELFNLFKDAVSAHTKTINKTNAGWSPTFCLKKPEGELYDKLCQFFVTIGNQFEGGYAGYLFRPTRLPGSMDVLTSLHKLPKNITLLGRPGGTLEAVGKFGAHIAFSRNKLEFSWMPNVSSDIDLLELNSALCKWISYIDEICPTNNSRCSGKNL